MKKISNFKSDAGFTLIELVLVISIIAILISIVMYFINPAMQLKRARDGQRKSDLRQIQSALEMYRADMASYPTSLKNCPGSSPTDLGNPACTVIYKKNVPDDPLGGVYFYQAYGSSLAYCLRACLENTGDLQKDSINNDNTNCSNLSTCPNGRWSFTLQNP